MTTKYTFSYYTSHKVPALKRRPWWNLWGKDSIVMEDAWTRHNFHGIPQDEADLIINASRGRWKTPGGRLIVRLIGPISQVQLEQEPFVSPYVITTDCIVNGEPYWVGARRVRNELHGEPT
jgi:hypothetical protein